MEIRKEKNFEIIEEFLQNNFSSPTHWPDWNLIIKKYYSTDFYYFVAYEDKQVIGILPIHERKGKLITSLYSGQYYYIPNGGWIFSKKHVINFNDFKEPITTMLSFNCLPSLPDFNVKYRNFSYSRTTLIVNLEDSIEDIWVKSLNCKRRNMIRKAEKNGITIKIYDKTNIDIFYSFYKDANTRNKLLVLPKAFFQKLFCSSQNIHFDILFAYQEKKPIGAIVLAYDKNYAFYWLGLSIANVSSMGQGELLQWEAVKYLKDFGCKYYDLCYIDKDKLPHIYRFKSGISSNEVTIASFIKKSFVFKIINKITNYVKSVQVLFSDF